MEDLSASLRGIKLDLVAGISLSFAIILSLANWSVEAFKWNSLVKRVHVLSDRELLSSIALGLCANILAPNRTGELAARLAHIPSRKRRAVLYLNLFGASSQLMVTFLGGLIGIAFIVTKIQVLDELAVAMLLAIMLLFAGASIAIFLRSRLLRFLLLKRLRKRNDQVESVEIPLGSRLSVLSLSAIRYLIFLLQFYLLSLAFNANIDFLHASIILSSSFLINSFVPSNWITEVMTKGSVIYFCAALLGYDTIPLVSATVGLWVVNLMIPSALSIYFLKDVDWMRLTKR